jgi:hypothetical protein
VLQRRQFFRLLPAVVCILRQSESAAAPPPKPPTPPRRQGKHQIVVHHKNRGNGWLEFAGFLAMIGVGAGGIAVGRQLRRVQPRWRATFFGALAGGALGAAAAVVLHWLFDVVEYPLYGVVIVITLWGALAGARSTRDKPDSSAQSPAN